MVDTVTTANNWSTPVYGTEFRQPSASRYGGPLPISTSVSPTGSNKPPTVTVSGIDDYGVYRTQKVNTAGQAVVTIASNNFDIIVSGSGYSGSWSSLAIFGTTFPNNATNMVVEGTGKNMYLLNGVVPDGYEIMGHFTRIKVTGGTAIAYRDR